MTLSKPQRLERCPGIDIEKLEPNRTIKIYRREQEEYLSEKQLIDYYDLRKKFLTYLLRVGKKPKKAKGYSPHTLVNTAQKTAQFDMWVWEENDGYKMPPDHDDAVEFMEEVMLKDIKESTKGKHIECLKRYSKWLQKKFGQDEWEFRWELSSGGGNNAPRDYLTEDERRKIREAALEMDGDPTYGVEVERLPEDNQEHSWKFASIVWVSLDTGLRPVEVGRARTTWCDIENNVLRIPREDSSKNEGNWTVGIIERTARVLERWIQERHHRPKYDDNDRLWLTRQGNPYGSNELRRLLINLCDRAGIEHEDRSMSWYAIRHSMGTYMTKERDLAAAKAQLRHKSVKTTMRYDQAPVEDRIDALDNMG